MSDHERPEERTGEACRGAVKSLWFAKRGRLSTVSRFVTISAVRAML